MKTSNLKKHRLSDKFQPIKINDKLAKGDSNRVHKSSKLFFNFDHNEIKTGLKDDLKMNVMLNKFGNGKKANNKKINEKSEQIDVMHNAEISGKETVRLSQNDPNNYKEIQNSFSKILKFKNIDSIKFPKNEKSLIQKISNKNAKIADSLNRPNLQLDKIKCPNAELFNQNNIETPPFTKNKIILFVKNGPDTKK